MLKTDVEIIFKTARMVTLELQNEECYWNKDSFDVFLNDEFWLSDSRNVVSLTHLSPDSFYQVSFRQGKKTFAQLDFRTESEYITCNVKDFGAKGNGISDDTLAIQTAIMACPSDSRVFIPSGDYKVTTLFLKSHVRIEIGLGATLLGVTNPEHRGVLPGTIESYDEARYHHMGTWEGNPLPMYSSIFTGIDVENVIIYGQGSMDGQASFDNWWKDPKSLKIAARPRLCFLSHCKDIKIADLHFRNSPAWSLHPFFCENIKFINITIENPEDSPNTDGLDIESCENVEVYGCHFSLGDDCIAIKSGKIYLANRFNRPSRGIKIKNCWMENGHGAVTIGSEIGAGVYDVLVQQCLFIHTDRGLRIKTRRGRGAKSIIQNITFKKIKMNRVKTPIAINSFYYCDPDGKTTYVQTEEVLPIDQRTPWIKDLSFEDIFCENVEVAAVFAYGLPEAKIESIKMENIFIRYKQDGNPDYPEMLSHIEPQFKAGFLLKNISAFQIKGLDLQGQQGDIFCLKAVDVFDAERG